MSHLHRCKTPKFATHPRRQMYKKRQKIYIRSVKCMRRIHRASCNVATGRPAGDLPRRASGRHRGNFVAASASCATRNIEPAPVTLAGALVARIAPSMPFLARSVSAFRRATAGWSNFSIAAMPAVMLIGLRSESRQVWKRGRAVHASDCAGNGKSLVVFTGPR